MCVCVRVCDCACVSVAARGELLAGARSWRSAGRAPLPPPPCTLRPGEASVSVCVCVRVCVRASVRVRSCVWGSVRKILRASSDIFSLC